MHGATSAWECVDPARRHGPALHPAGCCPRPAARSADWPRPGLPAGPAATLLPVIPVARADLASPRALPSRDLEEGAQAPLAPPRAVQAVQAVGEARVRALRPCRGPCGECGVRGAGEGQGQRPAKHPAGETHATRQRGLYIALTI